MRANQSIHLFLIGVTFSFVASCGHSSYVAEQENYGVVHSEPGVANLYEVERRGEPRGVLSKVLGFIACNMIGSSPDDDDFFIDNGARRRRDAKRKRRFLKENGDSIKRSLEQKMGR